ncbi:DUF732 domain-containing protein [Mycobacterium camsae]|uniref:DUF732 domain-containing protein n=1 Tax=Mycobacterium gordonae TaxID=1778 RepID=UPI00197E9854|nr:DUF732 domain-containing protein [Mycobacterium gordonae]
MAPDGSRYYGSQDDNNVSAYLAELREAGVTGVPERITETARQVCVRRAQGTRVLDVVHEVEAATPGMTFQRAMTMVTHAEWHFCSDAMYRWPGSGGDS